MSIRIQTGNGIDVVINKYPVDLKGAIASTYEIGLKQHGKDEVFVLRAPQALVDVLQQAINEVKGYCE